MHLMTAKENMIGITGTNARPSIASTFGVDCIDLFKIKMKLY